MGEIRGHVLSFELNKENLFTHTIVKIVFIEIIITYYVKSHRHWNISCYDLIANVHMYNLFHRLLL